MSAYTYGTRKDGGANAVFDGLNRVVCSFPDPSEYDTRKGSPTLPEETIKNARLFAAAPDLLVIAKQIEHNAPTCGNINELVTITIQPGQLRSLRDSITKAEGVQP